LKNAAHASLGGYDAPDFFENAESHRLFFIADSIASSGS